MDTKLALWNLNDFLITLEDKAFPVYGTALGLHRDGAIINHDLDVDVGIMFSDFNIEMINKLVNKGFEIFKIFGMPTCGFEMSFKRTGIKVDLMVFYKEADLLWNSLWNNGGQNGFSDMIIHSYPRNIFNNLEKVVGLDGILCPNRKYVEHVYGPEWRTPTTPWNWRTDHKCIDEELKKLIIKKYE